MSAKANSALALQGRAALYLRVSTGRQAEHDLSIPDQRRQLRAYCVAKALRPSRSSWNLVLLRPMIVVRNSGG